MFRDKIIGFVVSMGIVEPDEALPGQRYFGTQSKAETSQIVVALNIQVWIITFAPLRGELSSYRPPLR